MGALGRLQPRAPFVDFFKYILCIMLYILHINYAHVPPLYNALKPNNKPNNSTKTKQCTQHIVFQLGFCAGGPAWAATHFYQ